MTPTPDPTQTHPKAFGEELRRVREAAGVTVAEIVAETKISPRILDALESGAFGYLPERVFSRNFVIQYCEAVGVDSGPLAEAFDQAWERYQLASGSHPSLAVAELPPTRSIRWGFWLPIVLGGLILLVFAAVIVRGWTAPEEQLPPDPRRSTGARPSPTVLIGGATPGRRDAPVATPTATRSAAGTVEIAIEVDIGQECWVYVRDRDGRTDQQLIVGGDRLDLTLAGPVKLTVGNAGAVAVETGGERYEDLGGFGEVVHAHVDSDGLRRLREGFADGG